MPVRPASPSFLFNPQGHFFVIMLAAVCEGDAKKVAELMRQDPGFNVNMDQNGDGFTLLHFAGSLGLRSAMIPLLLAHPDIDVNVKDKYGRSPFYTACFGQTSCVRELLKDSRVKVNERDNDGYSPLWWAACCGHHDVIRWWIASGREMDLGKPGDDVLKTDAIGVAKNWSKTEVVALLERFKSDAAQTKHAMKAELGWYDELAAEVFAMVVFVSDGLLQIEDTTLSPAARFFNIAARLPLELQMVLCFRQVGSDKEIIPGKESEVAFKELARRLLVIPP